MLNKKLELELNKQLNRELFSGYLYQAMGGHFEAQSLRGIAKWLKVQALEEQFHAKKFFDYIINKGGKITLLAIDAPPTEWKTVLSAFEDAYKHECEITANINDLVEVASKEKDFATLEFLQWFVKEQVEEEAQTAELVAQLKMVGPSSGGLLVIDHHIGKRDFTEKLI